MYIIHRLIHFVIITLLSLGPKEASAQVNTESIDAYWNIVDQLKQDKDPSAAEWQAFFELPGNRLALKTYKDYAGRTDSLKKAFQLVYMPSRREALQATPVGVYLENILYTRDHESVVKEHIAFVKEGSVLDSMYQLAYRYLPPQRRTRLKNLQVYYIGPLTPESKARKDTCFINAAWEARFYPKRTAYVGAHELHHLLLPRELTKKLTTLQQARYLGVAMIANSLHREGVADLIDKKHFLLLSEDSLYRPQKEKDLQESDRLIIQLNTELERMANAPTKRPQLLPFLEKRGHTPGYYMALVIERNGYLPELLKNVDRPFHFLYAYNKAALKDEAKPPVFSSTAITFLKHVESLFP